MVTVNNLMVTVWMKMWMNPNTDHQVWLIIEYEISARGGIKQYMSMQ